MSEYIEREATKRFFNENFGGVSHAIIATKLLDAIPSADVAPIIHARWITRSDKGVISMTHPYMCSRCWRVEMNKEPYCNCGAKMDGSEIGETN